MKDISAKKKLEKLTAKVLLAYPSVKSRAEVNRYEFGTQLGKLDHIDYAIPLFGYAREAKQNPIAIYEQLHNVITAGIPCKTDFVNGYMNIRLEDKYLKELLESEEEQDEAKLPLKASKVVVIKCASDEMSNLAAQLLHDSLAYTGAKSEMIYPFPGKRSAAGQYKSERDEEIRDLLLDLPGVVGEPDSQALYLSYKDEQYALCSVKGGLYELAFALAETSKQAKAKKRVFMVGSSETNQLVKNLFPETSIIDAKIHAKHLQEAAYRPVKELAGAAKAAYKTSGIGSLSVKKRQELLYDLDFEHELAQALDLGDLKRVLGELTGLMSQHPVADVA